MERRMIVALWALLFVTILPVISSSTSVRTGTSSTSQNLSLIDIKVSGLRSIVNGSMKVFATLNNASVSQVIELETGKEIRANLSLQAEITPFSHLIINGLISDSEALIVDILLTKSWRVVKADFTPQIAPINASEFIQALIKTHIARIELNCFGLLISQSEVSANLDGEEIRPEVITSQKGTKIILEAIIGVNATPNLNVNVVRNGTALVKMEGTITGGNSSSIAFKGIIKDVQARLLRGSGIIEINLSTDALNEQAFIDRGMTFEGYEITIKPVIDVKAMREVHLMFLDEFRKTPLTNPVQLSIFMKIRESWLNITTSSSVTLVLPREPLTISVSADGYQGTSVELGENATQFQVYLQNLNPAIDEVIYRTLSGFWNWVVANWIIALIGIVIIVVLVLAILK